EPGYIGKLKIKNRIVLAAMGAHGLHESGGDWGERYRAYYEARAAGGVGLITTETTFVSQALEPFTKDLFNVASDKHIASMRKLVETLHSYDCKLSIQLTAGFGRVVPPPVVPEGVMPVSASENTHHSPVIPIGPDAMTRAITTEEAAALAQSFGYAAMRCREGGADCVELHGHEGYLLDQFMTPLWNRRDDRYGGSREKRLTFAREAIEAIKRDAGDDFPIIYRYGITHYLEGGREEDEGLWIAQELEKMGVAALHVDAGCYETHWWPHPPQYSPPGCMVFLAEKVKQVSSLPVITVGRLHYPEVAERALVEGKADFIAIGRGLLSEPEWVNKVKSGKTDELIPCLGCHEGCKWQMITGEPTSCALNPICGHEIEWALTPLKEKRSLLVVGGGPAGIEAARVGAARGFDVTLWEASDRLGGNLWPAAKPDFKHDIIDYVNYLIGLAERLPIDVVFKKRATAEDIQKFGADYVILATGAKMELLPLDGAPAGNVLTVIQVLNGMELRGEKILVMGGGVIGCETALYLARQGKQVTISTRRDKALLAEDLYDHNNRDVLLMMIKAAEINVLSEAVPVRFENSNVIVDKKGAEKKIAVDNLVFAGRMIPENGLSKSLENASNIFSVGDCVEPARIMEAVWGAFKKVREIEQ
ncbi:MAG: FAD-dependent oxidoreductase, partial [Deltaproteobacteria bacterium]|nr:FAD-dependent oxidoreductase [Deltaproteobacteria bacterium]